MPEKRECRPARGGIHNRHDGTPSGKLIRRLPFRFKYRSKPRAAWAIAFALANACGGTVRR